MFARLFQHACLAVLLAISVAGFSIASDALAAVTVKEKTSYYNVKGRTGAEITRSMLSGGWRATGIHQALAATESVIQLRNPQIVVRGNKCVLRDVEVLLELHYRYPKWNGRAQAGRKMGAAWDSFYSELQRHEKTHGKIARDYAGRIEKELRRTTAKVSAGCRSFGDDAARKVSVLTDQHRKAQALFDAKEGLKGSRIYKVQLALVKAQ